MNRESGVVDTLIAEPAAAPNPAQALWLQVGHHCRGVGDPDRWTALSPLRMNTKPLILLCVALPLAAAAQISYHGGTYTQDFNTLESGVIYHNYTTLPAGWVLSKGSYVWTAVTNGYSNNYGTYCFSSTASDPDKSIGLVIGTTGQAYPGARFRNTTGVTLTSFSLSYFAEQWAKGAVTSNDQAIPFEYSLDATNLTTGTFTGIASLNMHSIDDGNGSSAPVLTGNDGHPEQGRRETPRARQSSQIASDLRTVLFGIPFVYFVVRLS